MNECSRACRKKCIFQLQENVAPDFDIVLIPLCGCSNVGLTLSGSKGGGRTHWCLLTWKTCLWELWKALHCLELLLCNHRTTEWFGKNLNIIQFQSPALGRDLFHWTRLHQDPSNLAFFLPHREAKIQFMKLCKQRGSGPPGHQAASENHIPQYLGLRGVQEAKLMLTLLRLIQSWKLIWVLWITLICFSLRKNPETSPFSEGPWPPWELHSEAGEEVTVAGEVLHSTFPLKREQQRILILKAI